MLMLYRSTYLDDSWPHTGANYTPNKPTNYYLKDSKSVVYYMIVGLRHSGTIIPNNNWNLFLS